MAKKRILKNKEKDLVKINPYSAGIDIGGKSHYIAIPPELAEDNVREYKNFTLDLHNAAEWLKSHKITTVAMESTGVYWISLYDILEQHGIQVLLVNAKHVKGVPGKKSDVLDCQWLQKIHAYGLVNGSFIPDIEIRGIRAYMRYRENLVESVSRQITLMQKSLVQMNIQLHNVISDITGVTGQKILRAIVSGERDASKLASYRDKGCKNSIEIIEKSLVGNYKPEHVFGLKQALDIYDYLHDKIKECDLEVEKTLDLINTKNGILDTTIVEKNKKHRKRSGNGLHFDAHKEIINMCGVDLTRIDGINSYNAFKILTEIGIDMSRWPTVKHFASWLGLAPGTKISGNKRLSSATKNCVNRVATIFRMSAQSLSNSDCALGGFLRRKKAQLGAPKAITATAHKIAKIFYLMLKHKFDYKDLGAKYYEEKYRERIENNLKKKAKMLGFEITKISGITAC